MAPHARGRPLGGKCEGMSNNMAEYTAIIRFSGYLASRPPDHVIVYGDSDLVTNQLNGKWHVLKGLYREVNDFLSDVHIHRNKVGRESSSPRPGEMFHVPAC